MIVTQLRKVRSWQVNVKAGLKGTNTYIFSKVSSKTCSRYHPQEVEQFLRSGHAKLASSTVCDPKRAVLQKLMYKFEGCGFMDNAKLDLSTGLTPKKQPPYNRASRASGCQMCHGTKVELGSSRRSKFTWIWKIFIITGLKTTRLRN